MSADETVTTPVPVAENQNAIGRRNYYLALLTATFALNFLDRSIVNVLLQSIKSDLQLSDTALGFIAGLGFAMFYTVLGVPFARFADLKGYRSVIAFGVGLWSLMTAVGGWATTGAQLALARTGVGIGEAAGTAPSVAMVAALFPNRERPRALSILYMGMPIGIFAGISLGGVFDHLFGWRAALMIAGVPGLIVTALLVFTVKDTSHLHRSVDRSSKTEPIGRTLAFLFVQKSYVLCLVGSFFSGVTFNALFVWTPTLFHRVHGLPQAKIGAYIGLTLGVGGAFGTIIGGTIVSRWGGLTSRWKAGQPAAACLFATPFLCAMLFVDSTPVALICLAVGSFLMFSLLGPLFSVFQSVARESMRSLGTAIPNVVGTLGGLGLGALFIGMMSDSLAAAHGVDSIRYALLLPNLCTLPAALLYARAVSYIDADVRRCEELDSA